jgi:hypothetical protein
MATPIDQIGQHELNPTLKALAKAGGTTDHADWIRRGENAKLLIDFMNKQKMVQKQELFPFIMPSYKELKKEFHAVDIDYAAEGWDWRLHDSCKNAPPADLDVYELIRFGSEVPASEVINRILSLELRLPTFEEFLIWSRKNSGLCSEILVYCLGVSVFQRRCRYVPFVRWRGNEWYLGVATIETTCDLIWGEGVRFLVFPKFSSLR